MTTVSDPDPDPQKNCEASSSQILRTNCSSKTQVFFYSSRQKTVIYIITDTTTPPPPAQEKFVFSVSHYSTSQFSSHASYRLLLLPFLFSVLWTRYDLVLIRPRRQFWIQIRIWIQHAVKKVFLDTQLNLNLSSRMLIYIHSNRLKTELLKFLCH
jgi:hypothetical protein